MSELRSVYLIVSALAGELMWTSYSVEAPQDAVERYLGAGGAYTPVSYGFAAPDFGRTHPLKNYHEESVAAGRVIDQVDGKYVVRGTQAEQTTPFRIGGIYRQRDGRLVRLDAPSEAELHGNRSELHRYVGGPAVARNVATGGCIGWRDLASGRFPGHNELSEYNLLPGELDAQGNSASAPFRIGGIYRQRNGALVHLTRPFQNAEHKNCAIGPVLTGEYAGRDSGAVQLSDGRYIWALKSTDHASHLLPGELDAQGNPIFAVQGTVTARLPAPAVVATPPEKKRAPLTWNQPKKVDRFDGFVVTSGCQDQDGHPQGHVLQRFADPDRAVLKL